MITCDNWGVLIVEQHQHRDVSDALRELAIEHFIPMMENMVISRGRKVLKRRPLFGNYVPVMLCALWKKMLGIKGVARMLLDENGLPREIQASEIEFVKQFCSDGVYREPEVEKPGFVYGQQVTPQSGPFADHVGSYDSSNSRGYDFATFLLFGREQKVKFAPGELLAADGSIIKPKQKYHSGRWQKRQSHAS